MGAPGRLAAVEVLKDSPGKGNPDKDTTGKVA